MMEVLDDGRESTGDQRTARSWGEGHELAVEGIRVQPRRAQLALWGVGPRHHAGAAARLRRDRAQGISSQRGVRRAARGDSRPGRRLRAPRVARRRRRANRRRADRAGLWHRRRRLGLAGPRGLCGHAGGRPGGHVRGAELHRGPCSQRLVHRCPRGRVQPPSSHHQPHLGSGGRLGRRVGALDRGDIHLVAGPRASGPAAAAAGAPRRHHFACR
jgi:hypothetical protein